MFTATIMLMGILPWYFMSDLKFMAECGVSVAYHAKPIVRGQTTHAINFSGLDAAVNFFN